MLFSFLQGVIDVLGKCLGIILLILPSSPFDAIYTLTLDNELLQALAWLVPFPQIIAVLQGWVSAIAIFYVVQVILRTVNAIE